MHYPTFAAFLLAAALPAMAAIIPLIDEDGVALSSPFLAPRDPAPAPAPAPEDTITASQLAQLAALAGIDENQLAALAARHFEPSTTVQPTKTSFARRDWEGDDVDDNDEVMEPDQLQARGLWNTVKNWFHSKSSKDKPFKHTGHPPQESRPPTKKDDGRPPSKKNHHNPFPRPGFIG